MPDDIHQLLSCGYPISPEVFKKFSLYKDLLIKWQNSINLISANTINDIWQRHFLDSLQLFPYLNSPTATIADIGSGAGFPGMVLAIAGATNVHLIESDGKKISFLREAARLTQTSVTIHHHRLENIASLKADIIVSRACDSIKNILLLSHSIVSRESEYLLHKGRNHIFEINDIKNDWVFDIDIIPSITDSEAVIVKLTHLTKRAI